MSRFSSSTKGGLLLGFLALVISGVTVVSAWTGPSQNPPSGNASPSLLALWTSTTSNGIYYNSGNVGLGTTNPGTKLEVDGSGSFYGQGQLAVQWGDTTGLGRLTFSGGNPQVVSTTGTLGLGTNSTPNQVIINNGSVGIGTTTLPQSLTVAGSAYFPGGAVFMRDWDAATNGTSTLNYIQSGTNGLNFCTANAGFSFINCEMNIQDSTGNMWVRGQVNANGGIKYGDGTVQTSAGISSCTTVTSSQGAGTASISCSAGYTMTGGGCTTAATTYYINQSYPSAANTWTCRAYSTYGVTAYAICCH